MDDFNDEMLLEEEITFIHDINRERRINRRRRNAYYKNRRKKAVLHYQAVCYDTGRTLEWFFTEPQYPFKMNRRGVIKSSRHNCKHAIKFLKHYGAKTIRHSFAPNTEDYDANGVYPKGAYKRNFGLTRLH